MATVISPQYSSEETKEGWSNIETFWQRIGQENNSLRQYPEAETVNPLCKDDSALHSVSLLKTAIPARREKAQDHISSSSSSMADP